jgi:cell division septum initiation protein DivIVA
VDHIEDTLEENDMLERLIEWLQDELAHYKKSRETFQKETENFSKNIEKKQVEEDPGLNRGGNEGKISLLSPK